MNITWAQTPPDSDNHIRWEASQGTFHAEIVGQDGKFTLFFGNTASGHAGKGHHSANLGDFDTLELAQSAAQNNFDAVS